MPTDHCSVSSLLWVHGSDFCFPRLALGYSSRETSFNQIVHIVLMGALVKVGKLHAPFRIAAVEHLHSFLDGANLKLVRNAVHAPGLSFKPETAIAIREAPTLIDEAT
jgi:hypothetical protein